MIASRLIARLDIKAPNLVKGVQLEGLRKIGDPHAFAVKYAEEGADELLYMDIVASLYGRNQLTELLQRTTDDVFIPVTVGGGIRSQADVDSAFRAGADKVAINTAAISRPDFIREVADAYGCQAIVVSIEAKRNGDRWECYTDNGRNKTGKDAIEWAVQAAQLGAGEILVTSVDQEGTRRGFDLALVEAISSEVSIPVITCGGMGKPEDFVAAIQVGKADGVAMADVLHYGRYTIQQIKEAGAKAGLTIR